MEPNVLQVIADNPSLLEAVKAELLKKFSLSQINVSDLNNTDLADNVRARVMGAALIEDAFKDISRHRSRDIPSTSVNPAR
jgi:hypothetical protein